VTYQSSPSSATEAQILSSQIITRPDQLVGPLPAQRVSTHGNGNQDYRPVPLKKRTDASNMLINAMQSAPSPLTFLAQWETGKWAMVKYKRDGMATLSRAATASKLWRGQQVHKKEALTPRENKCTTIMWNELLMKSSEKNLARPNTCRDSNSTDS